MSRRAWPRVFQLELVRALATPRWFLAAIAWTIAAWDGHGLLQTAQILIGMDDWSGWDLHAAALNSWFAVVFILLPAFVILTADGVARDRSNRYAHILLVRSGSRRTWFLAKAAAILVVAVVFQAGFVGTCLVGAAAMDHSISSRSTAVGRWEIPRLDETEDKGTAALAPVFPPVVQGTNMAGRELPRSAYLALAFAALSAVLVAATVRWPHPWLPSALTVGLVFTDWLMNWFHLEFYARISPLSRLADGMHSAVFVRNPFTWSSSVALYLGMGLVAVVLGAWALNRVDV